MAKLTFEMSWNYSEAEYDQFLKENKLVHLKSHGDKYFKVGDALRSEKGCIARIMDKFNNYENLSHDYTIANNKLSVDEMYTQFQSSIQILDYPRQDNINGGYLYLDGHGHPVHTWDFEESIGD
jgi:hypothetical protein